MKNLSFFTFIFLLFLSSIAWAQEKVLTINEELRADDVHFGKVLIGSLKIANNRIDNISPYAFSIEKMQFKEGDTANFRILSNQYYPRFLNPLQSISNQFQYSPKSMKDDSATVIIIYSGLESPITFKLFGYGVITDIRETVNNNLIISPNPASDYIEITVPADILSEAKSRNGVETSVAHPRIFDLLGMEITTPHLTPTLSEGEGVVRLDVSHLSPGVYFVRVGDVVKKFVKY
jgi:hypothetical protein